MSDASFCRLSIDPPEPGCWNMGVDEALLDWAADAGACWMRFYQWAEPTVSLGYFQEHGGQAHAASAGCPVVRRLTGGGAIVHDVELTYSLVVPRTHTLARNRDALYHVVHAALVEALAGLSVEARLWPAGSPRPEPEPFLCFQRRAPGDVVAGQFKVAGSAQRRRRGAVLQHGSVLLGRSRCAPELAGLSEIAGRPLTPESLLERWLPLLAARLSVRWQEEQLPAEQRLRAAALAEARYAESGWTGRKARI